MILRMTKTNRLTFPESIFQTLEEPESFQVKVENGRVILTPVNPKTAYFTRSKLEALGITEQDVNDAIGWARTTE